MRQALLVDVQVACDRAGTPSSREVGRWVRRAVVGSGRALCGPQEVSVRVVDAEEMRALNRDFRQQDAVTNVLSFAAMTPPGLPAEAPQLLGDIILCADRIHEEAVAQGKALDDHWAHLLVHGTLHLLGYDHETDAEAAAMEALETRILIENGLSDPYA